MKIENHSKIVSDEAVKKLEEHFADNKNEKLKEISLRKGEVDVRELSDSEFKQVVYRWMNDMLTLANLQAQTLNDLEIILLETLSHNKKKRVAELLDGKGQVKQETVEEEIEKDEFKVGGSI